MTGKTTMYTLKPIVSLPETLYHSSAMYKMRNIHEEPREGEQGEQGDHTTSGAKIVPDIAQQVTSFLKLQARIPEFTVLESRQERILTQLAELKKQVSQLHGVLKQTIPSAVIATSPEVQGPVTVDLVVNANPKRPPYSILALRKVWRDTKVRVKNYVHSSTAGQVPAEYDQPDSNSDISKCNIINVSLIWKEVTDLEFTVGLHRYCVKGESNLLRYMSRLIHSHNYENSDSVKRVNATDFVLDACHALHSKESVKKKQEILSLAVHKLIDNKSDKQDIGIADIVTWSTIRQVFQKNVPPAFAKWFGSCEKLLI